jgi:hypothetical protein
MNRFLVVVCLLCSAAVFAQVPLAITHVNVVDVRSGHILRDRTLVISNDRITDLLTARTALPKGTAVFDATGRYAIPGLWDMHYHFEASEPGAREFNMLLANGVLSIRDMGDKPEKIFPARADAASGKVLGPRIVACGPIVDGPTPTNPPLSVSVHDADDARAMVHRLKEMGSDCVKVHDGVPLAAYVAIADEAKKAGLPLVGHVPVRVRVRQATDAGQRTIEHQVGLRGVSTVEDEVMESERTNDVFAEAMRTKNFRLIPESIAARGNYLLDHLSNRRAADLYRTFARNGTYIDPTLVTDRALTFVDDLVKQDDPRLKYIPATQREWWSPERGMLTRYRTPAYIAFRKRQFQETLRQISVAHRSGVQFLAGTDSTLPFIYPGFSVHDELALFVQAGLTPLQALQTATINPAKCLGLENSLGTIEPGKTADLVLLDNDPTKDVNNTRSIFAVILHGKLLKRDELDRMLRAAQSAAKGN